MACGSAGSNKTASVWSSTAVPKPSAKTLHRSIEQRHRIVAPGMDE
jgi:hypothetical protein